MRQSNVHLCNLRKNAEMLHEMLLWPQHCLEITHQPPTRQILPWGINGKGHGMTVVKVKTCPEILPPQRGILTHQNSDVLLFFLQEVL